ncbi:DUF4215 domain-containing protein [Nannocystis radixulma]|uniref:DUF4215 domain-containing protein n=1 Tax=Nannocystis radixulma TaxID=2995305 RepID=A0ABT5BE41_9BACT|nr:DUF4215 domain-containing protein [Nannocystis radixulma]MDC0672424.1 hypothetical protein [Nannocystis radixulma]
MPPPALCGDGVLAEGEACDDGNDDPDDGCDLDCRPTAVVEWTRMDRGAAEQGAMAMSVAVDPSGRIVVVGSETRAGAGDDAFVLVLALKAALSVSATSSVWRQTTAPSGEIVVDAEERIFAAGHESVAVTPANILRCFGPDAKICGPSAPN